MKERNNEAMERLRRMAIKDERNEREKKTHLNMVKRKWTFKINYMKVFFFKKNSDYFSFKNNNIISNNTYYLMNLLTRPKCGWMKKSTRRMYCASI